MAMIRGPPLTTKGLIFYVIFALEPSFLMRDYMIISFYSRIIRKNQSKNGDHKAKMIYKIDAPAVETFCLPYLFFDQFLHLRRL